MEEMKFYSSKEVAEMKGVTRKTVAQWIASGYLPGSRKISDSENSPFVIPQSAIDHLNSLIPSKSK